MLENSSTFTEGPSIDYGTKSTIQYYDITEMFYNII